MPDDRFAHHCQPFDDAQVELDTVRLIVAMRPYLPSRVGSQPKMRRDRLRRLALYTSQQRRAADRARIPTQRSVSAAEQEDRLFNHWPRSPRRVPQGGHL